MCPKSPKNLIRWLAVRLKADAVKDLRKNIKLNFTDIEFSLKLEIRNSVLVEASNDENIKEVKMEWRGLKSVLDGKLSLDTRKEPNMQDLATFLSYFEIV